MDQQEDFNPPTVYTRTESLRNELLRLTRFEYQKPDLPPEVHTMLNMLGEYEHGSVDVCDVEPDLTLAQYAAVVEDLAMGLLDRAYAGK